VQQRAPAHAQGPAPRGGAHQGALRCILRLFVRPDVRECHPLAAAAKYCKGVTLLEIWATNLQPAVLP
jgi:hypothetical protein